MNKKSVKTMFTLLMLFIITSCERNVNLHSVSSNYLVVDSMKIHFKEYGQGDKTFIFVHGWGCDLNVWQYQFTHFKNKFPMVFIDLPGYGKSDKPEREYTIDLFAKAVLAVIDYLNIRKPVLIGHSMGLPVCIQVIKMLDTDEAKLCNIDGVYFSFPEDSIDYINYKKFLNDFADMFKGEDYKQNVEQFVNNFITDNTPPAVKDYIYSTMPYTEKFVGYSSMQSLIDERFWDNEKLTNQTLAVYAKTAELPPDNKEILLKQFPNLLYIEMEGVNHFLMMEKPSELNQILEDFIKE